MTDTEDPTDPDPATDGVRPPAPGRKIDTTVAHSARVWNYWLGGRDHYEVDRAAGRAYEEQLPAIRDIARASREYLGRVVRYLVRDAGVRQFLDIGTGLPTHDNTHQVAQRYARDARVVYVDHDPLVLLHSQALLSSTREGTTRYIEADLHDPGAILAGAFGPAGPLDRTEPVGLVLNDVLGHVPDQAVACSVVRQLVAGLPSGSYLSIMHGTLSPGAAEAQDAYDESGPGVIPYRLRTREEVRELFGDLELVDPGLVPGPDWRPGLTPAPITPGAGLGGVARIP